MFDLLQDHDVHDHLTDEQHMAVINEFCEFLRLALLQMDQETREKVMAETMAIIAEYTK